MNAHIRPAPTRPQTLGPAAPRRRPPLEPLALSAARLDPASLLGGWQELNAAATIPHCLDNLERTGVIANFRRLTEEAPQQAFQGPWFADSDLYKTLEAIGWEMGRSGTDRWTPLLSELAELLEQVQKADGYLNTYVQGKLDEEPFSHPEYTHEFYCAGHLLQAAVALHRGGGDERFLAIARRVADLIVGSFGDGGRPIIDGHPEVETALIELYRETGEETYLRAAELQIERRGHGSLPAGRFGSQYFQDHLPVREATEAIGHSVRQLYLAAGVTDLYLENGDETLLHAMEQLWDSAFGTQDVPHRRARLPAPRRGVRRSLRASAGPCVRRDLRLDRRPAMVLADAAGHRPAPGTPRRWSAPCSTPSRRRQPHDGTAFFYSNPLQLRTGHDGSGEDAPSERLPVVRLRLLPAQPRPAATPPCTATRPPRTPTGLQLHLHRRRHLRGGGPDAPSSRPATPGTAT